MSTLETFRKHAKLLVRWHREGNYSVAGRIRQLPRYQALADQEALTLRFPLNEAQEIIALEAGCHSWAELKAATAATTPVGGSDEEAPFGLQRAMPVLFAGDVNGAADVDFTQKLAKQAWGGNSFIVRDPEGNSVCFASQR